ncbi:MAG: putative bifunctional diguanylate cyclase/phosphodiesterase [Janthinobacterium lividum]
MFRSDRAWGASWITTLVAFIAIGHVGVLALCSPSLLPSNVCQLLSASTAVLYCFVRARQAADRYFRRAWSHLFAAFALWAAGQAYFLFMVACRHTRPTFPSVSDFFWLVFAFPILMVVVVRRSWTKQDWVGWLDGAQAAIFFGILCALVFSRPQILSVWQAYDVQSAALVLAVIWRYSTTESGQERRFFRNLGIYLITYGCLSSVANRLQQVDSKAADWADLCWSLPPLIFCLAFALNGERSYGKPDAKNTDRSGFVRHLKGLSALGLSLMSLSAAAIFHSRRPVAGFLFLLLALLLFAIRTSTREIQLQDAHSKLQHAAFHDLLTGLPNRAHLLATLEDRLKELEGNIAVLYVDLDRFKAVNDSFGHLFGDRLLVRVASQLRTIGDSNDLLARLGGDEFVILTSSNDGSIVTEKAAAVVKLLQEPIRLEGRLLYLTASVGIVFGKSGACSEDLLRDADCAMYAAKHQGKNQLQVFDLAMHQETREALSFETDLRQAIADRNLTLHYQPIWSAGTQDLIGMEALSRWTHLTRGVVSPADFIPVAEETGLIIELGAQVLREACSQIQTWNRAYGLSLSVSVNLSARQLTDPHLLEGIREVLAECNLPATLLKLEVTESVLLRELDSVGKVLAELRQLGIQISLDDFGTGYSSLAYLLKLPFDVVKVDRSFVQALDQDPRRSNIVRTIIDLAHSLEKQVVAEGVETWKEREALEEMGCDLLQGYLLSKPLSSEQMDTLLRSAPSLNTRKPSRIVTLGISDSRRPVLEMP